MIFVDKLLKRVEDRLQNISIVRLTDESKDESLFDLQPLANPSQFQFYKTITRQQKQNALLITCLAVYTFPMFCKEWVLKYKKGYWKESLQITICWYYGMGELEV